MIDESKKWKKLVKTLGDSMIADLEAMDAQGLRHAIAVAESSVAEQERLRDADKQLQAAKEQAKDLGAAYRDAIAYQRAKARVASLFLDTKGVRVSPGLEQQLRDVDEPSDSGVLASSEVDSADHSEQ